MRNHIAFAPGRLLLTAALLISTLGAQSIAVTPANESVGLGLTKQFTAAAMGLSNSAVVWLAGGTVGGNAAAGTISSTGLYTAPAVMPAQNPVQIKAVSAMNSAVSGSVYLNILSVGPTLGSVAPNPVPVGTFTIAITGSGFLAGATAWANAVQLSTVSVTPTKLTATGWIGTAGNVAIRAQNPGSMFGNVLNVPFTGGSGGGGGSITVTPGSGVVVLGSTQQFSATGASPIAWTASAGSINANGLYTAPATMPATPAVTITASGGGLQGTAAFYLVSNVPPTIGGVSVPSLPVGAFSATVTGTGFTAQTTAQLGGNAIQSAYVNPTTLTVSGFAKTSGQQNLVVANGPLSSQPFSLQVGVANPQVSVAAARRFLEQAAFGPTPADAAHVQAIGFQAWLAEQFAMPKLSNYNALGSQSGLGARFLANAVTNPDQLRQRVAFAMSQIFVVSINKIIWNGNLTPFEEMLMTDAFTNYRQILGDVTLSPTMGQFLDMANNAKANPALGQVANENYAREIMQLFSIGTTLLNPDGTSTGVASYDQTVVTEMARVFTGWTYAPAPGNPVIWGAYITNNGPMVPYQPMHDVGTKTIFNGIQLTSGMIQTDLTQALDALANHQNAGPFFCKQMIQHLVKSNPSPAYVQRVAAAFANNGVGVRGDMKAVISAILLDAEARANDEGGADQALDGHLQEPALFLAGAVRAFGGQMTDQNYFAPELANMGEDIYNAPSVFNYFSPNYRIPGMGITGGEFQILTPNNAVYRANLIANLFSSYSNPVITYGPGTTIDVTAYVALAGNPAALVDALDLTLTHGAMPSAMKQALVTAVTGDAAGNLHRVETACFLILTSSYYNVWH